MTDVDRRCELASTEGRNADRCELASTEHSDHCITCGDDGIPMTVVRVDEARDLALCEDGGGDRSSVETALVAPVAPGEVLLVHAGTALTKLEDGAIA